MRPSVNGQFTVLDLYCGAGGLSYGFTEAGFNIVAAVDNNQYALKTYEHNIGCHTVESDLSDPIPLPKTDIIIGGPPCQGFSSAGLRQHNDHRNNLVRVFSRAICELRPRAFVFENVEGFLTAERGRYLFDLLTPLISVGYQIHLRKINAANYGIPQHRKRIIAIGGLGWSPSFPEPTHFARGVPGAGLITGNLLGTRTLIAGLHNLPEASEEPPGIPSGHYFRPLEGIDLERAIALLPGQTMRDLPENLQHISYKRRASRRVLDGTPTENRGGPPIGLRRLKANEPSKAITSSATSEFLHPYEHRPLTIRECARLQTFPDDFVFFGSSSRQMQQIGNAVPPQLAQMIAKSLKGGLEKLENLTQSENKGGLLSFVPTSSSGLSPILREITGRVLRDLSLKSVTQEHLPWD